jgi:hypothetical protein
MSFVHPFPDKSLSASAAIDFQCFEQLLVAPLSTTSIFSQCHRHVESVE